ncbi:Toll-like receptor 2 type-2 [Mizuhopecten yessoensis]|uniref:Toll-like receptor 2 type-2 n=2 Tax=Mizuhopecten yessoensis TaxID=6573 RepID=A0A210R0K6_MIZYE|nr:Toll-like receptor 2 type-2 [Mizuhopecten yessoensis]
MITSIPNASEMCPKTLKNLNLGNNRIWYLNTTSLKHGCPSVENLTLSGNYLRKLNFTSIPENVKSLQLHSTKLCQELPVLCRNKQPILRFLSHLDLSHNAFTSIDILRQEGDCLPSLQTLILDSNAYLIRIDTQVFSNLVLLRNLSLRQMNPLTKIDGNAFVSKTLESLQLEITESKVIKNHPGSYHFFQNCSGLTRLSVKNLNLKAFNENELNLLFLPLVNLEELELIDCGLTQIGFVGKFPELRRLNLHKNYISYWDANIFIHKRNFEHIDFSRNHIAMLKKSDFPDKIWRKTPSIDLHGNPFDCTYGLCGFRHWVSDNYNKLKGYPEQYFCESPDNLKGIQLYSWSPTDEECRKPEKQNNGSVLMEAGIIVGSVVVVACIIGVVIYRKRWNIKHYIYLMRSRKGYESLPDGEAYIYDAFVAYHYTDRPWIVSHLLPYLESQKKLRLCLHERDFIPGNFIADNILNNIESSRKVIVVLSNNFARSEWCQFEATTAYRRVVSDGVSSVVLILLEEISARNVNSVLGNLLQTMTYIDWTNKDAGRALFWSRLDDSLK